MMMNCVLLFSEMYRSLTGQDTVKSLQLSEAFGRVSPGASMQVLALACIRWSAMDTCFSAAGLQRTSRA